MSDNAADLAWLHQSPQHHILTFEDARYPALLREISRPPQALYARGNIELLTSPQIAIVGSRKPSSHGRDIAKQFAYQLAGQGLTITSGLALGIDGASHEGALAASGYTIAVLGSGLNRIYPNAHRALAEKIANHGLLLSEFPPNTPPIATNFPQRNRIISGLSIATLVVEAAVKSGSLITAHFAVEQGRDVFAIPGSIHNPQAQGCHALIKQGAKLVESIQDIMEELPALLQFNLPLTLHSQATCQAPEAKLKPLEKTLANVLEYVGFEPTSLETIMSRSNLPLEHVSAVLIQLEIDGFIESLPNGFMRI